MGFFDRVRHRRMTSREIARERLKVVLVQDRLKVPSHFLDSVKEAMLLSLEQYLEVDREGAELSLNRTDKKHVLTANIPIKGVRRKERQG